MSLARNERTKPSELLQYIRTEYDRLNEISPLIPPNIIKEFNNRFAHEKEISQPEETNGLEKITVYTPKVEVSAQTISEDKKEQFIIQKNRFDDSVVITEPCYIAEGVELKNCEIGPFVSIGANSKLKNCVISNTIIGEETQITRLNCENSMIGNYVCLEGNPKEFSIGDYASMS
jgi:NDP-sugar pyrophosphorylase family protein